MDMILARFCFVDLDTLIFAQLSEHLSDILFDLSVYDLSAVFRRKFDMIFTFPLRVCLTTDIKFLLDLIPPLIFVLGWLTIFILSQEDIFSMHS